MGIRTRILCGTPFLALAGADFLPALATAETAPVVVSSEVFDAAIRARFVLFISARYIYTP